MDIANLDTMSAAEAGAKMTVRHPVTDEPLLDDGGNEMWILVAGRDAMRVKRAENAAANAALANMQKGRGKGLTVEVSQRNIMEILVAATLDWSIILDKQTPECTPEKVREVYGRFPWLRDQVDEFCADRSNFVKASTTS